MSTGPVPGERAVQLQLELHHWAAHSAGTWALGYYVWDSDGGGKVGEQSALTEHLLCHPGMRVSLY